MSMFGQSNEFVSWTAEYNKETSSINITAKMKGDWVIYSQHTDPEGPIPLEFEFDKLMGAELVGDVKELTPAHTEMSDMFGVEVIKFKKAAQFNQDLKMVSDAGMVSFNVTYMTCDSKRCLPPTTVPLSIEF